MPSKDLSLKNGKDFFRHIKAEVIHIQQAAALRNEYFGQKENALGRGLRRMGAVTVVSLRPLPHL